MAERVKTLSRTTTWTRTATIPLRFRTFHPQGMIKLGANFFVSAVEIRKLPEKLATPAGVQAWRDAILGPTAIEGDVLSRLSDDELALLERASAVLRRVVTEVTEGDGTAV